MNIKGKRLSELTPDERRAVIGIAKRVREIGQLANVPHLQKWAICFDPTTGEIGMVHKSVRGTCAAAWRP